jgi:hypothetical protein
VANFTLIRTAYNDALKNSADGNKTAIAIKDQAKAPINSHEEFGDECRIAGPGVKV